MTQVILITFSLLPYLGLKASNHLFEPKEATNLNVGNWSRYCMSHSLVKNPNDFCKVWIGIKWNVNASRFQFERNGKDIGWHSFKYSKENNLGGDSGIHQCNYRDDRNSSR